MYTTCFAKLKQSLVNFQLLSSKLGAKCIHAAALHLAISHCCCIPVHCLSWLSGQDLV